jgi:hypothetical protein
MSLIEGSVLIPSEEVIEHVKVEEGVVKVEEGVVKVEEGVVKVEEGLVKVEEELPDFTNKSITEVFLYIMKKHMEEENNSSKLGIQLSKEIVEIINKIINKTPSFLSEIEKSVSEVIKDNKIDTNDIPEFVIIVQILYERIYNLKEIVLDSNKRTETCAVILKFIVHTLVEERKIVIEDDKKEAFLTQFDKLIDSCVSLLKFQEVLKPKTCCTIM